MRDWIGESVEGRLAVTASVLPASPVVTEMARTEKPRTDKCPRAEVGSIEIRGAVPEPVSVPRIAEVESQSGGRIGIRIRIGPRWSGIRLRGIGTVRQLTFQVGGSSPLPFHAVSQFIHRTLLTPEFALEF